MKIGILGFDQKEGKQNIGSSMIRVDWLLNYWPDAERFVMGKKYDVVIFQKAYWIDYAKEFTGLKILDLCDPDWIETSARTVEMISLVDGVTTSTQELADYVKKMTDKPVVCVPDRIDLAKFKNKKEHVRDAQSVVWFGYTQNFPALDQAIKPLIDCKLDLIVVSNGPYHPPKAFQDKIDLTNYPWTESAYADIQKGDMVINPKLSSERFRYKSNNKTLIAWALGLPVANNDREMKSFFTASNRIEEMKRREQELIEKWDVKISVAEYELFINKLNKLKCEKV